MIDLSMDGCSTPRPLLMGDVQSCRQADKPGHLPCACCMAVSRALPCSQPPHKPRQEVQPTPSMLRASSWSASYSQPPRLTCYCRCCCWSQTQTRSRHCCLLQPKWLPCALACPLSPLRELSGGWGSCWGKAPPAPRPLPAQRLAELWPPFLPPAAPSEVRLLSKSPEHKAHTRAVAAARRLGKGASRAGMCAGT